MDIIELKDPSSGSQARIAAHIGFNCYEFRAVVSQPDGTSRVVEVIDAGPDFVRTGDRPSWHGIPILFPFPNRIRGGRYEWAGRGYQIPSEVAPYDETGNAIHGFCLDRPWRVVEQTEQMVVGEFQLSIDAPDRRPYWPADCRIRIRYEVRGAALRATIDIHNPDTAPLPWGFGTHAYFRLPLSPDTAAQQCLIEASASEEWELIDCLPTGRRHPVPPERDLRDGAEFGRVRLDNVMTGLQYESGCLKCVVMDPEAGLQVTQLCPDVFRELVAFTPPGRNAVCLEPYTCVTDAINLQAKGIDAGLRVLPPGGHFRTWIHIEAGLVVA